MITIISFQKDGYLGIIWRYLPLIWKKDFLFENKEREWVIPTWVCKEALWEMQNGESVKALFHSKEAMDCDETNLNDQIHSALQERFPHLYYLPVVSVL